MAEEIEGVGVERQRKKTVRTESLPAAVLAKSKRGGTTAVVIN